MVRLIEEQFLDKICCYRALRAKEDSHAECEYYCSLPPRDYGNEPVCEYQCTKEEDDKTSSELSEPCGILYVCDRKKCGPNHDCFECKHTSDVTHAANFKRANFSDLYVENENVQLKGEEVDDDNNSGTQVYNL